MTQRRLPIESAARKKLAALDARLDAYFKRVDIGLFAVAASLALALFAAVILRFPRF